MNLHLNVEVLGGSSIHDACKEACDLADRINVTVDFKFNDITCIAHPGIDAESLEKSWQVAVKSNSHYKFATGIARHRLATDLAQKDSTQ